MFDQKKKKNPVVTGEKGNSSSMEGGALSACSSPTQDVSWSVVEVFWGFFGLFGCLVVLGFF